MNTKEPRATTTAGGTPRTLPGAPDLAPARATLRRGSAPWSRGDSVKGRDFPWGKSHRLEMGVGATAYRVMSLIMGCSRRAFCIRYNMLEEMRKR